MHKKKKNFNPLGGCQPITLSVNVNSEGSGGGGKKTQYKMGLIVQGAVTNCLKNRGKKLKEINLRKNN